LKDKSEHQSISTVILFGLRIYYVMSADFKLCIKCDKLVNVLDHHDDCYRHRVCNSEFPCERGLYFKGGNPWVVEAGHLNLNSGKC
jgi:hypothetical protein